jgi:hypothetical protein
MGLGGSFWEGAIGIEPIKVLQIQIWCSEQFRLIRICVVYLPFPTFAFKERSLKFATALLCCAASVTQNESVGLFMGRP